MIILGIDPGSRRTGFGLIDISQPTPRYLDSGYIRIEADCLAQKLARVYAGVSDLIARFVPAEMAIEQVFMDKNADSALKLGQARGSAIVCAANHGLPVHEYAARYVKQCVTGHGNADKQAVQLLVASTLKLEGLPQSDAADALAIALTHYYVCRGLKGRQGAAAPNRRSGKRSWRQFTAP